jgi:hypothetical protein
MATERGHQKTYRVIVDQHVHSWPESVITGAQIKALAGVDPSYGVWEEIPGEKVDPEIADDQKVDLTMRGEHKFFTGKKHTTEGIE